MDITSAWIFGFSHGTDFQRNKTEADEIIPVISMWSLNTFWPSEFPRTTAFCNMFGVVPAWRAEEEASYKMQDWVAGMCHKATSSAVLADQGGETLLCSHLRTCLLESDFLGSPQDADKVLIADIMDLLLASWRISGNALTYVLFAVSQRPDLQKALGQEVSAHFATESTQSGAQGHLDDLPVLDSIVKETLRAYSPTPGPWPRIVPPGGFSIDLGKQGVVELPEGTIITASSYCLHMNPDVFPMPEKWIPERWLEADKEQQKKMDRWMWAFGSGARVCIGQHFATRGTC